MEQVKNIGGIGSILLLTAFIPSVGQVLSFTGFVMVIIAVYKLSGLIGKKEIFNNYLIGIILNIAIFTIVIFVIGAAFLFSLRAGLAGLGIGIILALLLAWIILIVSAHFINKSFEKISQATGVTDFKTAGKLYFIGSILHVIIIGVFISLIAAIIQIVAFFSLPSALPGKIKESGTVS